MSKSDFECQCNLDEGEEGVGKQEADLDETPNELVEENKSLIAQLETQANEIKKLKETIAEMEARCSRQENDEPSSILDSSSQEKENRSINTSNRSAKMELLSIIAANTGTGGGGGGNGKTNKETDSLEDLIANYMSLIKGYRSLVDQLDQARSDNSQLKSSFDTLNQKYITLKETSTTTTNCKAQTTKMSTTTTAAPAATTKSAAKNKKKR